MEARQVEMMNILEVLGRQASVQQQVLMDTLEAAKTALGAVERPAPHPSRLACHVDVVYDPPIQREGKQLAKEIT